MEKDKIISVTKEDLEKEILELKEIIDESIEKIEKSNDNDEIAKLIENLTGAMSRAVYVSLSLRRF